MHARVHAHTRVRVCGSVVSYYFDHSSKMIWLLKSRLLCSEFSVISMVFIPFHSANRKKMGLMYKKLVFHELHVRNAPIGSPQCAIQPCRVVYKMSL